MPMHSREHFPGKLGMQNAHPNNTTTSMACPELGGFLYWQDRLPVGVLVHFNSVSSHCLQLDEDLKRWGILAVTQGNLLLSNQGFSWKSVSMNGSSNILKRTGAKHAPKGPL